MHFRITLENTMQMDISILDKLMESKATSDKDWVRIRMERISVISILEYSVRTSDERL